MSKDILTSKVPKQRTVPVNTGAYPGVITGVAPRSGTSKAGNPFTMLDITCSIDPDAPVTPVDDGAPNMTHSYSVFLELLADGSLDLSPGRNTAVLDLMDELRAADPTRELDSLAAMAGRRVVINVEMAYSAKGNAYNNVESLSVATGDGALPL